MVQSPDTTQFETMVENAISTGIVDHILSPQDLAFAVHDLINLSVNRDKLPDHLTDDIPPRQLNRILTLLQDQRTPRLLPVQTRHPDPAHSASADSVKVGKFRCLHPVPEQCSGRGETVGARSAHWLNPLLSRPGSLGLIWNRKGCPKC